uniref:Uncharacterized protein n=1 Tax=Zonotrichia albicollis TaxID=44394 RepID=A0A8D2QFY8_ZONAL
AIVAVVLTDMLVPHLCFVGKSGLPDPNYVVMKYQPDSASFCSCNILTTRCLCLEHALLSGMGLFLISTSLLRNYCQFSLECLKPCSKRSLFCFSSLIDIFTPCMQMFLFSVLFNIFS